MKLSEELKYRNLLYQTTIKDLKDLDTKKFTFYLGVDPSADSMTIGNLASLMLAKTLIKHGHKPVLLVGGATGLIGDPDGKKQQRDLIPLDQLTKNKNAIAMQFKHILRGEKFALVDNYDWFKNMHYMDFLRHIGTKVPLRTMLSRDFVQARLGDEGEGITYAEFSYSLIQGYDFYHLNENHGVNLQISGADQWGNSIAGVDITRRVNGNEVHVLSIPLIVNKTTGVKFGKSEAGAVWLSKHKTSATMFYQFWINLPDEDVLDLIKIYTTLEKDEIDKVIQEHLANPKERIVQKKLAYEVTALVHSEREATLAKEITEILTGQKSLDTINRSLLSILSEEIPTIKYSKNKNLVDILVESKLASSNTEARQLIKGNAVSVNGSKVVDESYDLKTLKSKYVLIRKGKAFRDSVLVLVG